MSEVTLVKEGNVGFILVNNPPVNALSQAVRAGLRAVVEQAVSDEEVAAIVLLCEGKTFMAGADIREFGKPVQPPSLPVVIDSLEDSPKPVVAAIHGTALGGGLEVALGCHFRIAVPTAKVGLPEVKLGLVPGAGGTQRLPRIAGVKTALDMIVSGDPVSAERARSVGIIDEIAEGDLKAAALDFAKRVVAEKRPQRKARENETTVESPTHFEHYAKSIARRKRGFVAPFKCIDAVRGAVELPFE